MANNLRDRLRNVFRFEKLKKKVVNIEKKKYLIGTFAW